MPDQLTGLLGRYEAIAELERRVASAHSVSAILIDIDEMKAMNVVVGHVLGDEALLEIARRIVSVVPRAASIGRTGGDEFFVMLSECSPESAQSLARAIGDAVVETPVLRVQAPREVTAEEVEAAGSYCGFYGPLSDESFAIGGARSRVEAAPRVPVPVGPLPVTSAFMSCSIGVVTRATPVNLDDLLNAVGQTLYECKRDARGEARSG